MDSVACSLETTENKLHSKVASSPTMKMKINIKIACTHKVKFCMYPQSKVLHAIEMSKVAFTITGSHGSPFQPVETPKFIDNDNVACLERGHVAVLSEFMSFRERTVSPSR